MVVVDPAVLFQPICLSLYSYFYFHYCHRWSILYGLYGRWSFLTEFVSRWLRSNSGADAFNNGFQWNSYRWQVNNKTTCSFWLNSMEKKWCTSTVSQVLLRAWMIVLLPKLSWYFFLRASIISTDNPWWLSTVYGR